MKIAVGRLHINGPKNNAVIIEFNSIVKLNFKERSKSLRTEESEENGLCRHVFRTEIITCEIFFIKEGYPWFSQMYATINIPIHLFNSAATVTLRALKRKPMSNPSLLL